MPVRDVPDVRQRLIDTWNSLSQSNSILDSAIDECQKRLQACVNEKGVSFKHLL